MISPATRLLMLSWVSPPRFAMRCLRSSSGEPIQKWRSRAPFGSAYARSFGSESGTRTMRLYLSFAIAASKSAFFVP